MTPGCCRLVVRSAIAEGRGLAGPRLGILPGQLARWTVSDWASVLPWASAARTAKYGPVVLTVIVVSKPLRGCEPAWFRVLGPLPASIVQVATSVAPFQLT